MMKVVLFLGTFWHINKVVLSNVMRVEVERSAYRCFSRKASLRITTANGDAYIIKNMKMDVCRDIIEKAEKESFLDLTVVFDKYIYIAERENQ